MSSQCRRVAALLGTLIASGAAAIPGNNASAQPVDARHIVETAQKRAAVSSQLYDGLLESRDASGRRTSEKRWTFTRIGSYGRSKAVIRFTTPPEVKGVALLIVNHPDRASDQWMWTPAIERDRRIALQDRSTRFFGTDFSFEDLEERDVDQYDYTLAGEETVDGVRCWKIQAVPRKSKSSQYTQTFTWIRKNDYVLARIESMIKDRVVRQLRYADIHSVQGIWTAREMTMTDLRRGTSTRLTLENIQFNVPLKDEDFTLQALRRQ
jgi:outer membrane lipoprotein-sorting protein